MRSSIACSRCRRSKVKCVNNGVNTTCRACENTGRECTYPSPALTGGQAHHVRRESSMSRAVGAEGGAPPANDTPRRPRPSKKAPPPVTNNAHSRDSIRAIVDALDASVLTPKVWIELFEIYQLHFSTDMPFLHPPTFLKPLRQASALAPANKEFGASSPTVNLLPPFSPMLLLAFLALTARYHPQLVAHHSPASSNRPSNPRIASEYYAAAAKSRLAGNLGDGLGSPEIERVQALLMLALFDWGNCQGAKAWISVGVALRYAQILGLQYEAELDDQPLALSHSMKQEATHMGIDTNGRSWESGDKGDPFIEREVKRRTFWSCFIIDRYLSSGKYRPQMINARDVRIQLPSSERAFLFGEKVRTLLLADELDEIEGKTESGHQRRISDSTPHLNGDKRMSPTTRDSPTFSKMKQESDEYDPSKGRWELGPDEGITSRFVKVLDLYGKLIKWSCRGGRRTEDYYPPWDPNSSFFQLQQQIKRFTDSLPRDMTLTTANISAHITSRTSTPYTMLHVTILLCNMFLHREFIPFIPLRCTKPEGPLEPPLFPKEKYAVPPGFWEHSAGQLFKSARDLIDLLQTCQEWGVLAGTPIVGFAIYQAACMGVYAINFPWMDTNGYMSTNKEIPTPTGGAEASRKALEMIGQTRQRLKMAEGWFKTIRRVHVYFMRMKKDFRRNVQALSANGSYDAANVFQKQQLSLREGGIGGGSEEFKLLERTLKNFGSLEDEDVEMTEAPLDIEEHRTGAGGDMVTDTGSPDSGGVKQQGWATINTVASGHRTSDASTGPNANGYVHQQHQQSGFSTPSLTTSPAGHSHTASEIATPGGLPGYAAQPLVNASAPQNATVGFASIEDARNASNSLQQQMNAQMTQGQTDPSLWSLEMEQNWLGNLETRFSGDDIAAFVEGNDWQDWAGIAAAQPNSGWLSAVWG